MTRFREIERLRGLAILLAIFNHAPLHHLAGWFTGVVGVHLFFTISGFVIALSLLRLFEASRRPLRDFYVRRFFRLFPLAALSIAIALAASRWLDTSLIWNPTSRVAREALAALTLTYNYRTFTAGWDIIYFWSLNVEEHFYLALPLVFLVAARRRWDGPALLKGFSVAWVAAVALRLLTAPWHWDVYDFWQHHFSTHANLDGLLAGVVLALAHHTRFFERPSASRELRFAATLTAAVAVGGLILVHRAFDWFDPNGWSLVELCSITLVALASFRRGYVLRAPVLSPVLEWLGARAYAIYLLHMGLWKIEYELLERLSVPAGTLSPFKTDALPYWGSTAIYAVALCIAAELSYRCLEQPLIAVGRRLTAARSDNPATPSLKTA